MNEAKDIQSLFILDFLEETISESDSVSKSFEFLI